jgi:hypothetical protein
VFRSDDEATVPALDGDRPAILANMASKKSKS